MMSKLLNFIKGKKCMCLDSVTKSLATSSLVESGFKTFSRGTGALRFENFGLGGKDVVPLDQWITAEEKNVGTYTSGFHIYTREKEHNPANLRRVYFRRAHTRGSQGNKTIVVAKEMYVPSDPDAWPPR